MMNSNAGRTASRWDGEISNVLIRFRAARAVMRGVTAPNCLKIASVCFHIFNSSVVPIRTSIRLGTKKSFACISGVSLRSALIT